MEMKVIYAVIFDKSLYSMMQCRIWLDEHSFVSAKFRETDKSYQFIQSKPVVGKLPIVANVGKYEGVKVICF